MSSAKKPPATIEEIEAALNGDTVERVAFMKAHEYMSFPPDGLRMKFSNNEVELILALLSKTHESFVDSIRSAETSKEAKTLCYNTALRIENLYASIFKQLKLDKPERPDLH